MVMEIDVAREILASLRMHRSAMIPSSVNISMNLVPPNTSGVVPQFHSQSLSKTGFAVRPLGRGDPFYEALLFRNAIPNEFTK